MEKNKKVGIITFHRGYNYGGFLQAYSVQKFLKLHGKDVEIINYMNKKHLVKELLILLWSNRKNFCLNSFKKFFVFNRMFKNFKLSKFYISPKKINYSVYSKIFFGSDQIWSYANSLFGYDPTYFGCFFENIDLIGFCASFGSSSLDKNNLPEEAKKSLKKFKKISVRDYNSRKNIELIINEKPPVFLDPVFLVDFPEFSKGKCPFKNFILVYAPKLDEEEKNDLIKFSKKENKKIISIGYHLSWADHNLVALSIEDFLEYFKKADKIVTSMFHGTILSIKYKKEFCSIVKKDKENKIKSMFEMFKIVDRRYAGSFDNVFQKKPNYKNIFAKIEKNKKAVGEFLKK